MKLKLVAALFILVIGYESKSQEIAPSQIVDSEAGIPLEIYQLSNNGPAFLRPDSFLFKKNIIQSARIRQCKVITKDSVSSCISWLINFDRRGNIILSHSNGSYVGSNSTNIYFYNDSNVPVQIKAVYDEALKDTNWTILNFTKKGWVHSTTLYWCSPQTKDVWTKAATYQYTYAHDTIMVQFEHYLRETDSHTEKYILKFDDDHNLTHLDKYNGKVLTDFNTYLYEGNIITEILHKKDWNYEPLYIRTTFDEKKNAVERTTFGLDLVIRTKEQYFYNENGTIDKIIYDSRIPLNIYTRTQYFTYSYF